MIIHLRHRQARHGRGGSEAAEAAGKPIRDPDFVGVDRFGQRPENQYSDADTRVLKPATSPSLGFRVCHCLAPRVLPSSLGHRVLGIESWASKRIVLAHRLNASPRLSTTQNRMAGNFARGCCAKAT